MFYVVTARLYVITDTNGTILISFYIYDYKHCNNILINIFIIIKQLSNLN